MLGADLRSQFSKAVIGGAMGLMSTTSAWAQSADAEPKEGGLGEIVVTAEKKSENLQRAAATIQVVSGEEIERRGLTDLTRLTNQTTSVIFAPQRANVQIFSRGLGQSDGQFQTTPSVEVDLDGVNLPKVAQRMALFDLDGIQVLKGPQGILYGRNAIGGAVVVSTRKPEFGSISIDGLGELGNYDFRHAMLAVNIPVSSTFAVRAVGNYEFHDGYLTTGAEDLNSIGGRMSLRFEPSDRVSLNASVTAVRRRGRGFANQTIPFPSAANGDPWYASPLPQTGTFNNVDFSVPENSTGFHKANAWLVNAELRVKLSDHLSFVYVPSYLNYTSRTLGPFAQNPNGILQQYTALEIAEDVNAYSNELRLVYDSSGVRIIAGVLQNRINAPNNFLRTGYNSTRYVNGPFSASESNYGLFANADIDITPSLRLTVGARQSWDRKGVIGSVNGVARDVNPSNFDDFRNFSIKGGLSFDLTSKVLLYAHVQTGYLPGHYQTAPLAIAAPPAGLGRPVRVKEQTVTAYTLGLKSRFLDNKVQLNVEGFYYDYRNMHANQRVQIGALPVTPYANLEKSRIYGADIDLSAQILPNGRVSVGLGLLDASIVDSGLTTVLAMQANGVFGPVADPSLRGYRLPNAPTISLNLSYDQRIPLGNGGEIGALIATHHESSRWLDYVHPQSPGMEQPGFWKTDVALTYYAPQNAWNIGLWARNLENSATYSGASANSLRSAGTVIGAYTTVTVDAPRTYGVRLGFGF